MRCELYRYDVSGDYAQYWRGIVLDLDPCGGVEFA